MIFYFLILFYNIISEQLRIQRQVEYEMLQKEHSEAQERLKRSEELISDTKTRLSSIAAALAAVPHLNF
jgi:hypothetical protein